VHGIHSVARSVCGFSLKIEVECQSQEEAEEAIQAGADIVMLDNFKPDKIKTASSNIKVWLSSTSIGGCR
jgi:nicotinate-nucleotide pyrophosphorylase (carboxylating)